MNEMDTYIPPNIRLINTISKRFTTNRRFTSDEPPTWVEQSQDLMLRSTVSFLIVTHSGTVLSFNHLSNCIFPYPLLFLAIYTLHARYLFVTDTLSTQTITSVEWQDLLIPTRLNACIARIDLGLKSHSSDWAMMYTTPLPKGITQISMSYWCWYDLYILLLFYYFGRCVLLLTYELVLSK